MSDRNPASDNLITLLIPTHNRHHYLDRIMDYYSRAPFPVVVADSTRQFYTIKENKPAKLNYLHLPGETLNAKLEIAIQQVYTPYIVMCADDDFLVLSGIDACITFLQEHPAYSCVQGNCIAYAKMRDYSGGVPLSVMYKHLLSYEIAHEDPFERVRRMFSDYRTLFYAVHRTASLSLAFRGTAAVIKNLYLNEYITGIIPLIAGKYRELNVFYQVREFADDSGDKTTINLDAIAFQDKYAAEFEAYVQLMVAKVRSLQPAGREVNSDQLTGILREFAGKLNFKAAPSLKKKIGNLLGGLPILGPQLIRLNRRAEREKELKKVIKNKAEAAELQQIESMIRKYASLI